MGMPHGFRAGSYVVQTAQGNGTAKGKGDGLLRILLLNSVLSQSRGGELA